MRVNELIELVRNGDADVKLLQSLLQSEGENEKQLLAAADAMRMKHHGDRVKLRGIIEFSNYCGNHCHYCGLRAENGAVQRYRYTADEIVEAARVGIKLGYGTIVLQAGEDNYYDGERLASIVRAIKKIDDIAITVSFGVMSEREYRLLRAAGVDRYLMKHETSNKNLFETLRPGTTLRERVENLDLLKILGFQIGSGMMIGLPGTSVVDIANDILLLRALQVEMAGVGPFVAHPATPLRSENNGSVSMTLRAIAVTRLLLPCAHLPATTALGTLDKDARKRALCSGANVIMPNVSPRSNRSKYEIYPDKAGALDDAETSHQLMMEIISAAGRIPAFGER